MAKARSISLSKFTASVQAAVRVAVRKHPKFNVAMPSAITSAYLIRGIPVPEAILAKATFGETQSFANELAGQISGAHPELAAALKGAGPGKKGAILSVKGHVIVGIPAVLEATNLIK